MELAKVYSINEGKYRFLVCFRRRGFKTYKRKFADRADANRECKAFNKRLLEEGRDGIQIGAKERDEITACMRLLDGTGLSLIQAVEIAVKREEEAGKGKEIMPAITNFLEAKERQGRAARTLHNLKSRLYLFQQFTKAKTLREFTPENCEHFIYSANSKTTQVNHYRALFNFARFCIRKGWLNKNPLSLIERPNPKSAETVETFTPSEAAEFLKSIKSEFPQFVAFYSVLLFAFLRPSEAETLKETDFQKGRIRVVGGKMRGRKRRFVPIPENLKKILERNPWKIPDSNWQRKCRKLSPIPWKGDICRHSGISYRLALSTENETAKEAGNSPETLFRYYHEPKSEKEAREYFEITFVVGGD